MSFVTSVVNMTIPLKGHYNKVKNKSCYFSVMDMLRMFPITYSKYSGRKIHI